MRKEIEVVYGVEAIAVETDTLDDEGKPDRRRTYYKLEMGYVPGAQKMGDIWALSIPTYRRAMHGDAAQAQ
ncbi:MAG: hypothetical protein O7G13_15795 [Alphaproteobacteria bacterium]|nr:hypothetical protein [Alphaproteobacteria bacterium]